MWKCAEIFDETVSQVIYIFSFKYDMKYDLSYNIVEVPSNNSCCSNALKHHMKDNLSKDVVEMHWKILLEQRTESVSYSEAAVICSSRLLITLSLSSSLCFVFLFIYCFYFMMVADDKLMLMMNCWWLNDVDVRPTLMINCVDD